jgi:hypothetical protein
LSGLLQQLLPLLAAASLGLLAGALLAEDRLLLPYWRTLPADEFYALHPTFGPRLYRFFAPLTTVAPLAAVLAAVQAVLLPYAHAVLVPAAIGAGVLASSLIAIYFGYFKAANEAFARRAVGADDLPAALTRWAAWHRLRVVLCLAAFGLSLLAIAALRG